MEAACRSRCVTARRSSPAARARKSCGSWQSKPAISPAESFMLRAALAGRSEVDAKGFRLRGREVSRVEGLSDAVFGFAITLLVVSLEVPNTFDELIGMMRGFVAFGASF